MALQNIVKIFREINVNAALTAFLILVLVKTISAETGNNYAENKITLPQCGSISSRPFGNRYDAWPRKCQSPVARNYIPKYSGIGYEILNIDSEACFVPDELYRMLDELIGEALKKISYSQSLASRSEKLEQVRRVSKQIGEILTQHNFSLYMPTDTLSDALTLRNKPEEPERHIADCDTMSFIYLTIAENLNLPLSLVEINLPNGAGHNYVRWQIEDGLILDWDTNARAECAAPEKLQAFQGKSMKRAQVMGYVYAIRAAVKAGHADFYGATVDYQTSIKLYPESPFASNNLAWMLATKNFEGRDKLAIEALAQAGRAVAIERRANYLDTLACTFALNRDFESAIRYEKDALALDPKAEYMQRLKRFMSQNKQDCTGIE